MTFHGSGGRSSSLYTALHDAGPRQAQSLVTHLEYGSSHQTGVPEFLLFHPLLALYRRHLSVRCQSTAALSAMMIIALDDANRVVRKSERELRDRGRDRNRSKAGLRRNSARLDWCSFGWSGLPGRVRTAHGCRSFHSIDAPKRAFRSTQSNRAAKTLFGARLTGESNAPRKRRIDHPWEGAHSGLSADDLPEPAARIRSPHRGSAITDGRCSSGARAF